jgi:hypothetical protein
MGCLDIHRNDLSTVYKLASLLSSQTQFHFCNGKTTKGLIYIYDILIQILNVILQNGFLKNIIYKTSKHYA